MSLLEVSENDSNQTTVSVVETTSDLELVLDVVRAITASVVLAGAIGNTFTYIISSKLKSQTSGTAFMKYLAFVDNCCLFWSGMPSFTGLLRIKVQRRNQYTCKTANIFRAWTLFWANYTLLSLTVDRVIALWKPQYYREKMKPEVGRKVSIGVGILFCVINAPVYFFSGLIGDVCFLGSSSATITWLVPPWIIDTYKQLMMSVGLVAIPFVTISALNSFIVYKLKKSGGTIAKNERDVTVSLMMVCLFYLTMNAATTASTLAASQNEVRSERDVILRGLLLSLAECFACMDHSINFVCYMVGSPTFRGTLFRLFQKSKAQAS